MADAYHIIINGKTKKQSHATSAFVLPSSYMVSVPKLKTAALTLITSRN